jgi:hypothetical protein
MQISPRFAASLLASIALLTGCTKPAESNAPAPAAAPADATPAAAAPATPTVAGIPAAAIASAERAVAKVEAASAGATEVFNEAVIKAKALMADKRFPEALKALETLQDVILSPAQQKTVDDLRAQITKGMELLNQAKGVSNLLGK